MAQNVLTDLIVRGKFTPSAKASVLLCSSANIALGGLFPGIIIDGVAIPADSRVLLVGQIDSTENGIYDVTVSGATRSADAAVGESACGMIVAVGLGNDYGGSLWLCPVVANIGAALNFTRIYPNAVTIPLWTSLVTTAPAYANGKYYPYEAGGSEMSVLFDYNGGFDTQVINLTTGVTIATQNGITGSGFYRLGVPAPVSNARLLFQVRGPATTTIYSAMLEYVK